MGDFTRIYPPTGEEDPYQQFKIFAEENFQNSMGANRKSKKAEKQEEVKPPPPKIKRPPSTFSTTPDLYRRPIAERKYEGKTSTNLKN